MKHDLTELGFLIVMSTFVIGLWVGLGFLLTASPWALVLLPVPVGFSLMIYDSWTS